MVHLTAEPAETPELLPEETDLEVRPDRVPVPALASATEDRPTAEARAAVERAAAWAAKVEVEAAAV
jgi:hypothetical protein